MPSGTCTTVTIWNDGKRVHCQQPLMCDGDTECYAHQKYFTKGKWADGEMHWLSGPASSDRRSTNEIARQKQKYYITAVVSTGRGMRREIGDEYSE